MNSAFIAKNAWFVPASLASLSLVASVGIGTMGAYNASLTNEGNTAGTGSLIMTEVANGGRETACTSTSGHNNAAVCSSVNKYGGKMDMKPGDAVSTDFTLRNDGTVAASNFTLVAGQCSETGSGKGCGAFTIQITESGNLVFEGTPNDLAGKTFTLQSPVAPKGERSFKVTAKVPENVNNDAQGAAISQALTWTFTA